MRNDTCKELFSYDCLDCIPDKFRPLFSGGPVLPSERLADYAYILALTIDTLKPTYVHEWIVVKDYVDLTWEINQYRRLRIDVLNIAVAELVSDLSAKPGLGTPRTIARKGQDFLLSAEVFRRHPQRVLELIEEAGLKSDMLAAQAFVRRCGELEKLERLSTNAERRRAGMLASLCLLREHAEALCRISDERLTTPDPEPHPPVDLPGDLGVSGALDALEAPHSTNFLDPSEALDAPESLDSTELLDAPPMDLSRECHASPTTKDPA
ncbi:hypothetical protein CCR97_30655 [Rhodoplanes elegans]|uniref:Uncharacterized protein n=1 Tax=Rhodoplanes elegans TaxID=29408 RepID=A0A327KQD8_9BRAD|nr:hypothetical protein [Rhodoplanes elegans]MBK5962519.1 hypothetical protein [Rhodoplanes elegans]RAI41099.1 hypothetical protein CH338_04180 [Rhodoplanes elegans]